MSPRDPENRPADLRLTEGLYTNSSLKRVFFSAYIPVAQSSLRHALVTSRRCWGTPAYQDDWLRRFYAFAPRN
jgi:predicted DNA-binding helix-hairpin-helix protein